MAAASFLDRVRAALSVHYDVLQEQGRGGMATVFRARDRKHDRLVAIKLLHPELAEAVGSERFLQEVRITARLNHPHILPLLDSGSADGLLYYVMPFVEGESLRQRSATRAAIVYRNQNLSLLELKCGESSKRGICIHPPVFARLPQH